MGLISLLFGTPKNGAKHQENGKHENPPESLSSIRERIKIKVSEPVIPKAVQDRMEADMDEASEGVTDSSRQVKKTLCDINEELDARADVEEEAPA